MSQLQYVKHQDIDFNKWDNTILSSQFPFVFAQSFYLSATCPQWDALVIGDYESVFPVTYKTKFGYRYLPQPPFTSQLGAYGKVNPESEQLFYNYILGNFRLIDLELNTGNQLKSEFIVPKNTFYIDYGKEYKFNQNTKRNITKALENDFIVEQVSDDNIVALSKKYLSPFLEKEVHLAKTTVLLLDDLLRNAMAYKALYTFRVVNKDNSIKALAHFICNGKHALYLKGTNFDKADNSGSMHLVIAHAIDFFKDKALLFDFGGGSNSEGLANFYRGFGGETMEYGFLRVNRLPWLIKFLKNKK
ncbi:MAG: hypothetical protein K0S53_2537 [Bacteroidetes bacterium]|jgi:hypothetical protein|nr:hypothetical protein [Bacteroidota bacterium]MDF2452461.1 hypothetical protein [Bacteroidota bacterium]